MVSIASCATFVTTTIKFCHYHYFLKNIMDEVLVIAVQVLSSDKSLFKIENPSKVLKQCSCSICLPASDNSRQLHFSNPGKPSMSIAFSNVSTVLQVKAIKQKGSFEADPVVLYSD